MQLSIYRNVKKESIQCQQKKSKRMSLSVIFKPSKDGRGNALLLKLHLCKGPKEKTINRCMIMNKTSLHKSFNRHQMFLF